MTLTGDSALKKFMITMSNYWIVFGVVSTLIVCLVLEVSILSVSGFSTRPNPSTDIPIFTALSVFSIIAQLTIMNFVYTRNVPFQRSILRIMHMAMVFTQLAIIVILVIILFEVNFMSSYYLIHLDLVFMISSVTAIAVMGVLSYKFITWFRLDKSKITFAYLIACLSLSLNAIIGILYVSDQLSYASDVIEPRPYGGFLMHGHYSSWSVPYTICFSLTFVLFWIGTVLLLNSYRKRLGTIKFWIIMLVPLLYFLSQFQPLVTCMLLNYSYGNPVFTNIIYVLMLEVSTPVGGILFGIAFMLAAHKIQNSRVKGYLVISGIGLLLLLISYRPQEIITGPFPPFGLLSVSFIGMSSYLVFFGIYSSAISVSQDSNLRKSIRKSVEAEVNFIGTIASAEMTNTITERVLRKVKAVSDRIPQDTGIATSLTDVEIKEYVATVINETRNRKR